jgi:hypothetical protein
LILDAFSAGDAIHSTWARLAHARFPRPNEGGLEETQPQKKGQREGHGKGCQQTLVDEHQKLFNESIVRDTCGDTFEGHERQHPP